MRSIIFKIGIFSLLLSGCVQDSSQIVLQSIKFSPETITMSVGNSIQLAPVFTPTVFNSIAVEWYSSDATKASISSTGLLYAAKPGTITVTIKDKNSATAGKCLVIVQ